ncbi:5' nucleotidase family protein [Ancylostoma ceylanicum]|uniref:5' nucleotidase family protein n=1 Tax=Ancylostoma ceylanicum TaxID=53326 RepID=A0A0D6MC96_9BILA|nr:5' nucleotidase family protein [Ancylostoma ceylanicum]
MPQLIDLFSLPWAGLLSTVVHYCDTNKIVFDPKCLFDDLAECVKQVHITGEMYRKVSENLKEYVHPNEGLKEYLELLHTSGKEGGFLFMYLLFENDSRILLKPRVDIVYLLGAFLGNIDDLSHRAGFKGKGVLYFGDHIYTDLADPILRFVGEFRRNKAVLHGLGKEVFRKGIQWLEIITAIIETYQAAAQEDPASARIIAEWRSERARLRLADVYTSRVPNMLKYDLNHCFFPRRNALPHENLHSVPIHAECILDVVKQKEQMHTNNVHV